MFGISLLELLLVFAIILIVFGPKKLPELAKTLGGFFGTLTKSSDAVRREFYDAVYTQPALEDPKDAKTKTPANNSLKDHD